MHTFVFVYLCFLVCCEGFSLDHSLHKLTTGTLACARIRAMLRLLQTCMHSFTFCWCMHAQVCAYGGAAHRRSFRFGIRWASAGHRQRRSLCAHLGLAKRRVVRCFSFLRFHLLFSPIFYMLMQSHIRTCHWLLFFVLVTASGDHSVHITPFACGTCGGAWYHFLYIFLLLQLLFICSCVFIQASIS